MNRNILTLNFPKEHTFLKYLVQVIINVTKWTKDSMITLSYSCTETTCNDDIMCPLLPSTLYRHQARPGEVVMSADMDWGHPDSDPA